mgnify:CR=1 FL=1
METSNKNIKIGVTSNNINATFELPWDASYEEIVRVFLSTQFEGGRHAARVDKMMALENK